MYVLYFCSTVSLNDLIATKAIVTQSAAKGQATGHAERTANGTWQDATKNFEETLTGLWGEGMKKHFHVCLLKCISQSHAYYICHHFKMKMMIK
jgi:hypothetical protein